MKRRPLFTLWLLTLALPASLSRAAAPTAQATAEEVVQLPAFVVDGKAANPVQWLYAEVAGVEILSCLPLADTNWVVNALRDQSRLFAWGLPPNLRSPARRTQLVLDDRPLTSLRLSLQKSSSARDTLNGGRSVIIGMALHDWDFSSTYLNGTAGRSSIFSGTQSEVAKFGASVIGTASTAMWRQTPTPPWLIPFWGGGIDLYARNDNVTFTRMRDSAPNKSSPENNLPLPSLAVAFRDPEWLPTERKPTTTSADEAGEWFVRWAVYADEGSHRGSFWNFVKASTIQSEVDDALVRQHFGLSLAELDERVRKFRTESQAAPDRRIPVGLGPIPPTPATRAATDVEIARILGQWTLVALRKNPEFIGPLSGAARRMIDNVRPPQRNEAQLTALLGLVELQAGQIDTARPLLESVSEFGGLDARSRFEIAQLRYKDAIANAGSAGDKFNPAQVAQILAPLAVFRSTPPGNPDPLALVARTWAQAAEKPAREELLEFFRLARAYPRNLEILLPTAQLCFQQNLDEEAADLATIALQSAQPDAGARATLDELRQQIAARATVKK
ncbi:MAG: hypothetical protein ABIZ81_13475 [Opitutaceae bacterium]